MSITTGHVECKLLENLQLNMNANVRLESLHFAFRKLKFPAGRHSTLTMSGRVSFRHHSNLGVLFLPAFRRFGRAAGGGLNANQLIL